MGVIILGERAYGRVDAHGGEYAQTTFFHVDYLPLIPRASFWVTRDVGGKRVGYVMKLDARSVIATYVRVWGVLAVAGVLIGVPGTLGLAIAAAIAAVVGWSWTWRSLRGARARRRSDFNAVAFGMRCEPERLPPATRASLQAVLGARWSARSDGRSPNEVARHGTGDVHQAVLAYGLLRLAAVERGRAGDADRADAERFLDGAHEPLRAEAGPYRDRGDGAAAAHADAVSAIAAARIEARALQAGPPGRPRWWQRPRVQLVGLVYMTLLAMGGAVLIWDSMRGPSTIGASELASTRMLAQHRVAVDCDDVVAEGSFTDRGTTHQLAFCHLGDRVLPVVLGRNATPDVHVVGTLRPITQARFGYDLDVDPELGADVFDWYVDASDPTGHRFSLVAGLGLFGVTAVWWVFWIKAWRRRRRARAAA